MTVRRRVVRVPASSANLGPGYDVLAAALGTYLELEVAEAADFSVTADGLDVPLDRSNLCVRGFEELHPAEGLAFSIRSEIPLARGLGSSGAAIVAGLVAADHMFELGHDPPDLLQVAAGIEGHPDNVAASLYGGFVACAGAGSSLRAVRFDPPEGLEAIAVVPAESLSTTDARAAVPAEVATEDAIANIAATACLLVGLLRGDLDLVGAGLADRIHQPHRGHLYPRSLELVEKAGKIGALGATISGAGPTVLVWTYWEQTGSVAAELQQMVQGWAEAKRVSFAPHGADVTDL
jgi:homoserine kinase